MPASKTSMFGNPFVGIFAKTNDKITLAGKTVSDKFIKSLEVLGTEVIKLSINNCDLIGLYSAINNKGMVFSQLASVDEVKDIKISDYNIVRCKLTATGNNIVANDHGAIVNPDTEESEIKKIKDALDVEVMRSTIAGYKTVGAMVIATNNGFIAHPKTATSELELLKSIFHVDGGIGTSNMGVPFPGISIIANKNGFIVGELTTGFESGRINDCLGFI
jgi:translation initiation factor 6